MFDIITVGSNTVDAFVKTRASVFRRKEKKSKLSEEFLAYPIGSKIIIRHLDFQVGGGGTNTAVAFARLGFNTAYLGKIGKDDNGVKVFKLLKKENVKFIGALGDQTGFSVVLDSIKDDRTILVNKGCNDDLLFEEINLDNLRTKWFYFSSMSGKSLETQFRLAKFVSEHEINLAFNPSNYVAELGMKKLKPILNATKIFICNLEEGQKITGKQTITEIFIAIKKIVKGIIVITNGKEGAWCYDGNNLLYGKPKKNLKVVETTGAGDAFASGFVSGIMKGKDLKTSLRMGFIEAECVIEAYGAKNNLASQSLMAKKLRVDNRIIITHTLTQKRGGNEKKLHK